MNSVSGMQPTVVPNLIVNTGAAEIEEANDNEVDERKIDEIDREDQDASPAPPAVPVNSISSTSRTILRCRRSTPSPVEPTSPVQQIERPTPSLVQPTGPRKTNSSDSRPSGMQEIRTLGDIAPFSGSIVAYKTNEFYLNSDAYPLNSLSSVCFGRISSRLIQYPDGDCGYSMNILLQKNTASKPASLTALTLARNSTIHMRAATILERQRIENAIRIGEAEYSQR